MESYISHIVDAATVAFIVTLIRMHLTSVREHRQRVAEQAKEFNERLHEMDKRHIKDLADIYNREQINGKFENLGDRIEKMINSIRTDLKGGR